MSAAGIVFGTIPAMHGGEDAIRTGLQGYMKVRRHAIICGKKFYEVSRDIHGLDGTHAQTFEARFVEEAAQQLSERNARAEISPVGADIYAAENDFFYT